SGRTAEEAVTLTGAPEDTLLLLLLLLLLTVTLPWLDLPGSSVVLLQQEVLRCSATSQNTETRCEYVHKEAEHLDKEKKNLRLETKQLQHALRRHRSVKQVCDEVECVEKTLLKRRAELRQADRLLLEAQSCIHTSRDKARSAQQEADVLQRSAQDGATCLLEATQHIRELQEEVEELRRRRQEEEQSLRELQEELRSREQELQKLGTKLHWASDG
ncbi:centriolin-like, partial [Plectropomus leopardus]|uniref:centriolin-like n=1 Tax=Plectropomus leopardus TaxID=160734 RepID=UPI001C4BC3D4